jgi:Fe2+ transport system protein FeoA
MSGGCAMVRCPHCGYEFVESGRFVDMLRRWIRRAPKVVPAGRGVMCVSDMPVGSSAEVAFITPTSASRVNRLASFGIVAGTDVRLVARRPTVVLACGTSTVAIEDDVAREVFVQSGPVAAPAT